MGRFCKQCGNELVEHMHFCSKCGEPVKVAQIATPLAQRPRHENTLPKVKFCKKCGKPLTANMRFCNGCGTPVQIEVKLVQPVISEVSQVRHQKFCKKCGKALTDSMRFCNGCGTPIESKIVDALPEEKKRTIESSALDNKPAAHEVVTPLVKETVVPEVGSAESIPLEPVISASMMPEPIIIPSEAINDKPEPSENLAKPLVRKPNLDLIPERKTFEVTKSKEIPLPPNRNRHRKDRETINSSKTVKAD